MSCCPLAAPPRLIVAEAKVIEARGCGPRISGLKSHRPPHVGHQPKEGFVTMAERKLTKSEVKFEHPAKMPGHNCGKCVHWEPPIACAIVQGVVRKEDWCDRWKAKKK